MGDDYRSSSSVHADHSLYPVDVVGHFGVDAVLAALAAALAEARDAEDGPPVAHRAEQRPARVAGARVDAALAVARAEHVLRDEVVLVHLATGRGFHYRNLTIRQPKDRVTVLSVQVKAVKCFTSAS